ncbi:SseB protein N-terminal domain-containing protein [Aliiroseovarius halocynthiae]|uniref:SseB family protein n=1 Tax=Aliiroseovarius halocynthiae TaxID=985055 RepID=A0A545SM48_9RHOB|nr:SseB family protein [Aliiroseovarius halocynthiae]TQV66041.1 SseB family protein [Aliiroseovarius halocynthiae]SMR83251.1 SseB protein N-terminal domain-containing protein [Aliiroseovarius halocynthiae]
MSDLTQLDHAHAAMHADLNDDAARMRFYERLADRELFLLLATEPQGEDIEPELFELETDKYVLVFDREERLAEFVGQTAPYAALPGRVIAGMLAGQGIGLGVNLGVAPSSILIPAEAMDWLAQTLSGTPDEVEAQITEILPPSAPETLLTALAEKLGSAGGLADYACLAGVRHADGRHGHLLGFIAPADGAERALAGAVNEALTFSGLDAGELDVGFFTPADEIAQKLTTQGLRFDLPAPKTPEHLAPVAPGSNPEKPPILK